MAHVKELTGETFSSELSQQKIALVDFYASWCGSCRLFAPAFERVAGKNSALPFYKVDGDSYPETREGLEIDNLPFVAIYENGKPVGGLNISKEDALEALVAKVRTKAGLE
jgi:thioredoxin 1